MNIYFVVNTRIPNEKAHGIQIARMYEAFVARGIDATIISPRRTAGGLYSWGKLGFAASTMLFMLRSTFSLFTKRLLGETFIIYTVDMDSFSYALLPLIAPTFAEMHSPKRSTLADRFFFARARGIIATTRATRDMLQKTFSLAPDRIIVEPNGVSVARFTGIVKEEARAKLSLPLSQKIAVYVGRLYGWKGLEILPHALAQVPEVEGYVVGGERKEFEELTHTTVPKNMHLVGVRPNAEIPLWLAAADTLIVLGTARNSDSMLYTSPMKVFEYLAAERPIIASKTPALEEVLKPGDAQWYEPDNAASLALAIRAAVAGKAVPGRVAGHDWSARAARIVHFIEHA